MGLHLAANHAALQSLLLRWVKSWFCICLGRWHLGSCKTGIMVFWNPKEPPVKCMYKTPKIMVDSSYYPLVQDFFHQQYWVLKVFGIRIHIQDFIGSCGWQSKVTSWGKCRHAEWQGHGLGLVLTYVLNILMALFYRSAVCWGSVCFQMRNID